MWLISPLSTMPGCYLADAVWGASIPSRTWIPKGYLAVHLTLAPWQNPAQTDLHLSCESSGNIVLSCKLIVDHKSDLRALVLATTQKSQLLTDNLNHPENWKLQPMCALCLQAGFEIPKNAVLGVFKGFPGPPKFHGSHILSPGWQVFKIMTFWTVLKFLTFLLW